MFSSKLAEILYPLYSLTSKKTKWKWGKIEEDAFQAAKEELVKKRTLAFPNPDLRFYVSVDASDFAFGANLYQFQPAEDGQLEKRELIGFSDIWSEEELSAFEADNVAPFIVESFSKKWTKAERNYTTSEKECLAIINAVERWRHYLAPRDFTVWSDHKALKSLTNTEKPRLKRWRLRLTPFTFNLRWKAGKTMKDVDSLSRSPHFTNQVNWIQGYAVDSVDPMKEDVWEGDAPMDEREIVCSFAPDSRVTETPTRSQCFLNLQSGGSFGDQDSIDSGQPLDVSPEDADLAVEDAKAVAPAGEANEEEKSNSKLEEEVKQALLLHSSFFAESQDRDSAIKALKDRVRGPKGNQPAGYSIDENGILNRGGSLRVVIPKHERGLILWMMHDHPLSGHIGQKKMLAKLRERFHWPGMAKEVKNYIKKCACSRTKAKKSIKRGRTIVWSHYGPLECLQYDIVGEFPTSKKGNRYWLTLIDRYTRYVELIPIPTKEAGTVAKAIYQNWITRLGCPKFLMSDNEFRSEIQGRLAKLIEARQLFTAPYKPSTNGLCERVHGFAEVMLQNAIKGNIRDWDDFLPAIRFGIITSKLDGFPFSPYSLLYGREARLPVDVLIPRDAKNVPKDIAAYFNTHAETLREIRALFDYQQDKVSARMRFKRDRDQNRKPTELQVGDLVFHTRDYYGSQQSVKGLRKLLGRWRGPSKVVKKLNANTFEVEVAEGKRQTFNVEHLAVYSGEDPPIYRERPASDLDGKSQEGEAAESQPTASDKADSQPIAISTSGSQSDSKAENLDLRISQLAESKASVDTEVVISLPKSALKKRVRFADDQSEDSTPPAEKKQKLQVVLDHASQLEHSVGPQVGGWVLVTDTRERDRSIMLGRITKVDSTEVDFQVYEPTSVQKRCYYLPLWSYPDGSGRKASDEQEEGKVPWIMTIGPGLSLQVVMSRPADNMIEVQPEDPPKEMVDLRTQVWDRKLRERDLPVLDLQTWMGRTEEILAEASVVENESTDSLLDTFARRPLSVANRSENPPGVLGLRRSSRKRSVRTYLTIEVDRDRPEAKKRKVAIAGHIPDVDSF
jgi:transposase InsO family protein